MDMWCLCEYQYDVDRIHVIILEYINSTSRALDNEFKHTVIDNNVKQ